MQFSKLYDLLSSYFSTKDLEEVERAYFFAKNAHEGQLRLSGEPYIHHPLAVAYTLAEMHLDRETILAALLHDVPEDTLSTLDSIKEYFGEGVASLVEGVTKLGKVRLRSKEERQAENIRKMMLAVAKDVRVILVKLADRLHNMQTIQAIPSTKQQGIARETLEIYAPLAHRLGMYHIKWQLEDLSFRVLDYEHYSEIELALQEKRATREHYLSELSHKLAKELEVQGIEANISFRPKHLYGIYRNVYIKKKDRTIDSVLDVYGLRVVVPSISECYRVLGVVHSLWKPLVNRLKDFIAVPKSNGYQSLHTGVICDGGKFVEVQIRTYDMEYMAEYGLAAHWRYKENVFHGVDSISEDKRVEQKISWIRQLLEWQKDFADAEDFVESLKLDLFQDEIFVFTPKGEVRNLPLGATPVDFAYTVHTDLGNSCIGAKVNSKIVPLDYQLKSGDIIEILSSKTSKGPSRNWLEFVKTSSTRNRIRRWFRKEELGEMIKIGKDVLEKECRKIIGKSLNDIAKERGKDIITAFKMKNWENLYAAVGYGNLTSKQVVDFIIKKESSDIPKQLKKGVEKKKDFLKKHQQEIIIEGMKGVLFKLDPYCSPVEGDHIVGFITRGKGVTIHKYDCPNIRNLSEDDKKRLVRVYWNDADVEFHFVTIEMTVFDRVGLMRDVVTLISSYNINIYKFDHERLGRDKGRLKFTLELHNMEYLRDLIAKLQNIASVLEVRRLQ